jgi:hypothetical protein
MATDFKPRDKISYKSLHQTGLNDYPYKEVWHHGVVVEISRDVAVVEDILSGEICELRVIPVKCLHEYKGQE